jgi:hypothetical protein
LLNLEGFSATGGEHRVPISGAVFLCDSELAKHELPLPNAL